MPLMTVNEIAEEFAVSKTMIYRRVGEDRWPHYRVAGELRFDAEELRELFKKNPTSQAGG